MDNINICDINLLLYTYLKCFKMRIIGQFHLKIKCIIPYHLIF